MDGWWGWQQRNNHVFSGTIHFKTVKVVNFICVLQCFNLKTAAKSLQLCPTLCDPIDGSPPGSPVPGILQARTLEWVAISFSNAWKWKVKVKSLSRLRLLATPWTAAYQAPPSIRFSRQEYWSGVPLPSPIMSAWCIPMLASLVLHFGAIVNSKKVTRTQALWYCRTPNNREGSWVTSR